MSVKIKRKKNIRRILFVIAMLSLPLLHVLVFSIYVNVRSIVFAFQNVDYESNTVIFVGFKNFTDFFKDFNYNNTWKKAIINSLMYFPLTNFIILPLSLIFAYFIFRKVPFSGFYVIVYFLPSLISIVVLGMVYKNMLSTRGPIANILVELFNYAKVDVPRFLVDPKYAMNSVYIYAVWVGLGYNIVLIYGAIARIPTEILESARLDGVSMTKEIFQIIVPIVWPTITTLFIFGTISIFGMFIHSMILTPNGIGETWTIAYLIFRMVSVGGDYYKASAIGLLLVLVAVPIVQGTKYILEKIFDTVEV